MSGGRDRRAVTLSRAYGIAYTHALRLIREGKVKVFKDSITFVDETLEASLIKGGQ